MGLRMVEVGRVVEGEGVMMFPCRAEGEAVV